MATGIRTEPLDEPLAVKLRQECRSTTYEAPSVRVFPSGCAHTSLFPKYAERFRNFEIREDDVWVVSYPKSGKRKKFLCLNGPKQHFSNKCNLVATRIERFSNFSFKSKYFNPINAELNSICHLLALLGVHNFLHVSRIRFKSLTLRLLISYIYIYIYGAPILDVSRSHTTTHHSR